MDDPNVISYEFLRASHVLLFGNLSAKVKFCHLSEINHIIQALTEAAQGMLST